MSKGIEEVVQEVMQDLARAGVTLPLPLQNRLRSNWLTTLKHAFLPPVSRPLARSIPPPLPPTKYSRAMQMANQAAAIAAYSYMPLPEKPEEPLQNSTKFGEISAFRVWRIRQDGFLTSAFMPTIWEPGKVLEADGVIEDYFRSGQQGNGIHAWKSIFEVLEYSKNILRPRYDPKNDMLESMAGSVVIGKIKIWGDVIEHDRGYRAQYAKLESLDEIVSASRLSELERWREQSDKLFNPLDSMMRQVLFAEKMKSELRLLDDYFRALSTWKWREESLSEIQEIYFPKPRGI